MGMLNYETLLSSYDDKLTLMQWLKKVEAALKNATASSFVLNKKGNATISFSIVFEDGTSLESGDIVLQQGESVQSAYIQNGHLHLVLTNGDDLDAGNMFNGDVTINGNFEVTGRAKLPNIEGDENNNIKVDGNIIIADGGISVADGAVSTPILTSENDHIEAQKPVVEVMNGYSFVPSANLGGHGTATYLYAGACKNGNKLTFVIYTSIVLDSNPSTTADILLGRFDIPADIYNKLQATSLGSYTELLDFKQCRAYSSVASSVEVDTHVDKYSQRLNFFTRLNNLSLNTTYYLRYEVTFLLSENLAA